MSANLHSMNYLEAFFCQSRFDLLYLRKIAANDNFITAIISFAGDETIDAEP